jgi:preprotein translocase subunit SecA
VLNARKHTEESQIIAGAGAFGAITIATNMAGRGVDIKLGGELREEILATVNRVLSRAGHDDPYEMTMEERKQALDTLTDEQYGIYEAEVREFFQYMEDMQRVREAGGLHVIGSERHEARRIDNQLRGRSSRQGDPGSSRFYLSMEDELMRLFGGQQANDMMQRLRIDDALPIEHGMVSRIIEQSQSRVEGANFDTRKHLLEYDDVLNQQREKIYSQRNRIFIKDDLSEDVTGMLRTEVLDRVPAALADEGGPWKLLAWLNQIQPPLSFNGSVFPSYTLRILVDSLELDGPVSKAEARELMLDVAENALEAEAEHLLETVETLLISAQERMETQLAERMEMVDTFLEGLTLVDETDVRGPRELADELSELVRLPIRLSSDEQRALREDPYSVAEGIHEQVERAMVTQTTTRLLGAVERRLDESLDLNPGDLSDLDWDDLTNGILEAIESLLEGRQDLYIGEEDDGLIAKDLDKAMARVNGSLGANGLYGLLMAMPQGARATFDRKTHRRVWLRTTRMTYVHYAAEFLEGREPDEVAADVLAHLEDAQAAIHRAWGGSEYKRLSKNRIAELDAKARRGLRQVLGDDVYEEVKDLPLPEIKDPTRLQVVDELGRQAITEVYRQLLLGVISELWVDYLTQMEALRVSIGLEAYAQRDPLVQYKTRASQMFQVLLSDMRSGVVNRMFTFQPRDLSQVKADLKKVEPPKAVAATATSGSTDGGSSTKRGRRRRRRRRRR